MEISEIKARLSIQAVLRHYRLNTNKHDMLCCPFHEHDSNASLKIYPKTNTFYCFSCGATGDQIRFIEMYEKLTKHEAILKAQSLTGTVAQDETTNKNIKPMKEITRRAGFICSPAWKRRIRLRFCR